MIKSHHRQSRAPPNKSKKRNRREREETKRLYLDLIFLVVVQRADGRAGFRLAFLAAAFLSRTLGVRGHDFRLWSFFSAVFFFRLLSYSTTTTTKRSAFQFDDFDKRRKKRHTNEKKKRKEMKKGGGGGLLHFCPLFFPVLIRSPFFRLFCPLFDQTTTHNTQREKKGKKKKGVVDP